MIFTVCFPLVVSLFDNSRRLYKDKPFGIQFPPGVPPPTSLDLLSLLQPLRVDTPNGIRIWKATRDECAAQRIRQGNLTLAMPMIPRSGNSWLRRLMEGATGLATLDIFETMEQYTCQSGRARSAPTGLKRQCKCGIIDDCARVRQAGMGEPVIIKSHWPSVGRPFDEYTYPTKLLFTIRNPIDNFEGWKAFKRRDRITFNEFFQAWLGHFAYWLQRAEDECIPVYIVRFEDLVLNTEAALSEMLEIWADQSTGRWSISPESIKNTAKEFPGEPEALNHDVYFNPGALQEFGNLDRRDLMNYLSQNTQLLHELGYDVVRPLAEAKRAQVSASQAAKRGKNERTRGLN